MKMAVPFILFSCRRPRRDLQSGGSVREVAMRRRVGFIACCIAIAALGGTLAQAKNPWKNPANYSGQFTVLVHGYWNGQGTATVSGNTVQIVATVNDDQGNIGQLQTDALTVVNNHFEGGGSVMGIAMTIDGRVEPQDQPAPGKGKGKGKGSGNDDQVTTNARIGATLKAGGHAARIAGGRAAAGP